MISVIICSVNKFLLNRLEKNIAETIGVPFEIIAIDNSLHHHGICKVYNEGGAKARYPYLCFTHEDVSFETKNWGERVCKYLADSCTGLLGIAGGDCKGLVPSSWSMAAISNEINIIQHYKFNSAPVKQVVVTNPATEGNIKRVVTIDGVWLCTKKEIFEEFRFDEITFTGFHGYDIDYSLQVNTKYNSYVIFDIVLHHFSEGSPDKKWIESALRISKKWKKHLPVSIHNLSAADYTFHHWRSLQVFLQNLFCLNYSYASIIKFYLAYSFTRFFSLRRFLSMGKYVTLTMMHSNYRKKLKNN
jgi:Glycosyltransferase like family